MKRAALIAAPLLAGVALTLHLTVKRSVPQKASKAQDFSGWARLGEHEALATEILRATEHPGSIRVYLDTLNPHRCAYVFVAERAVVLTEKCSAPPRSNGRTNWRVVGVLAHEIGHIVNNHLGPSETTWKEQSQADEFAGFAMRMLGATLEEAQTFRVPEPEPFAASPEPNEDYLYAIKRGWKWAGLAPTIK